MARQRIGADHLRGPDYFLRYHSHDKIMNSSSPPTAISTTGSGTELPTAAKVTLGTIGAVAAGSRAGAQHHRHTVGRTERDRGADANLRVGCQNGSPTWDEHGQREHNLRPREGRADAYVGTGPKWQIRTAWLRRSALVVVTVGGQPSRRVEGERVSPPLRI